MTSRFYRRSWAFFALFLAVNSVLAYAPLGLEAKLWTALGGLLLSGLIALSPAPPGKAAGREQRTPIPAAVMVLFLALVVFLHFFRPETLPSWPLADDGRWAFFSLDQAQQWKGRLLWGESQILPLSIWLFGFIYKWVPFNAVTFRMIPALLSLAAVAAAYLATRKRFSPAFAFYFAGFTGLGFWTLSFSRMLVCWTLYLILEFWALSVLLRFLGQRGEDRTFTALELGVAVGLAYDTALIGKALLAVVVLTLLAHLLFREKGGWVSFALFLAAGILLMGPVAWAELGRGGMNYLLSQKASSLNFTYLVALFWDGFKSAPYGPAWGGCFNPIVASLASLGFLGLWEKGRRVEAGWVLSAGLFFLLPGLLSIGTEMFRVLNILPVILGLAAFGLEKLSLATPKSGRAALITLLLVSSTALDVYHYLGPYQQIPAMRKIWRNEAYSAMYGRLRGLHAQGTRLGLLDFTVNDYDDHTFDVLTRSLNGWDGLEGKPAAVDQIALVADVNYRPFLEKRFPQGRWSSFPENFTSGEPGWTLGVIPAAEMTPVETGKWAAAAGAFSRVRSLHMYWQRYQPLDPILRDLFSRRGLFEGDPFLESVFWEEAALFFNIQRNLPYALASYQKALKKGYPAAQLYNDMGTLEALKGSMGEARADFKKALAAPLNRTTAAANLEAVAARP